MDHLSELDDCIKDLENLQLTLDLEQSPNVEPKKASASSPQSANSPVSPINVKLMANNFSPSANSSLQQGQFDDLPQKKVNTMSKQHYSPTTNYSAHASTLNSSNRMTGFLSPQIARNQNVDYFMSDIKPAQTYSPKYNAQSHNSNTAERRFDFSNHLRQQQQQQQQQHNLNFQKQQEAHQQLYDHTDSPNKNDPDDIPVKHFTSQTPQVQHRYNYEFDYLESRNNNKTQMNYPMGIKVHNEMDDFKSVHAPNIKLSSSASPPSSASSFPPPPRSPTSPENRNNEQYVNSDQFMVSEIAQQNNKNPAKSSDTLMESYDNHNLYQKSIDDATCDIGCDFPEPPPPIATVNDGQEPIKVEYSNEPTLMNLINSSNTTASTSIQYATIGHPITSYNQQPITSTYQASSSPRKASVNSLKLSAKPLQEPLGLGFNDIDPNNNNQYIYTPTSSQSNLSNQQDKDSRSRDHYGMSQQETQKTVVRFFCTDKTTKALMVDEAMTVESIIRLLMEKSFWSAHPQSSIVEKVPTLKMERFFEEQESLLNCINSWPNTCANMIFFEQRQDTYGMFENAKTYLGENYNNGALTVDQIMNLKQSVFYESHEYQDYLYVKKIGENSWKRLFCILRTHGIFAIPKKKSKKEVTVMMFQEHFHLYTNTGGWTKEWNAPTPFGFAFKPYSVIDPKSNDLILFCATDEDSMKRWCSNLRLCKFRDQIIINYEQMRGRSILAANSGMNSSYPSTASLLLSRNISLSPGGPGSNNPYNSLSRASLQMNGNSGGLLYNTSKKHPGYTNTIQPKR